jgi:hypothetical protein
MKAWMFGIRRGFVSWANRKFNDLSPPVEEGITLPENKDCLTVLDFV